MHTKAWSCLLFVVLACSPEPGVLEGGFDDEAGSSSDSNSTLSGSDSSGNDSTDSTSSESSEGPQPSICESCSPDEMCVGKVFSDLCFEGFNYEIVCVPRPATCETDPCDPACLLDACGDDYQCVPECSGDPVDLWCAINNFAPVDCSLDLQDCPDGEKCVPIVEVGSAYDAAACVPILGDAQPGESCILDDGWHDDCALGSYCTAAPNQVGTCQGLCDAEGGCPDGEGCLTANEGLLPVCLPLCDLEGMCSEGQACTQGDDAPVCVTSPSQQGSSCAALASCSSGFACVDAATLPGCASTACCTSYCDITDPGACEGIAGVSCVPFFEGTPPPGFETLGLCIAA